MVFRDIFLALKKREASGGRESCSNQHKRTGLTSGKSMIISEIRTDFMATGRTGSPGQQVWQKIRYVEFEAGQAVHMELCASQQMTQATVVC